MPKVLDEAACDHHTATGYITTSLCSASNGVLTSNIFFLKALAPGTLHAVLQKRDRYKCIAIDRAGELLLLLVTVREVLKQVRRPCTLQGCPPLRSWACQWTLSVCSTSFPSDPPGHMNHISSKFTEHTTCCGGCR